MKAIRTGLIGCLLAACVVVIAPTAVAGGADDPKDAQPATKEANAAVLKELNFADREDFELAPASDEYPARIESGR